jgi:hypothetical protein
MKININVLLTKKIYELKSRIASNGLVILVIK